MLRTVTTALTIVLSAALLIGGISGCEQQSTSTTEDTLKVDHLSVLSPHGPAIRDAFADRFSLWYEQKTSRPVSVRWIHKGTLACQRFVFQQYAQYPNSPPTEVDVFFGGGAAVHSEVARRGYAEKLDLPEELVSAIPEKLNGLPLRAEDGSWYGSALGGFGILYNKQACELRGVPEPTTWADLAGADYAGWVAMADPSRSGSTVQCLVLAMLKHGWDEGWGVVTGMMANCNGICASSSQIAPNVLSGLAVAGLEPEFVARMSIADHEDTLSYVNPPAATAITPDPITVLRSAQNLEVARLFVEFVLSEEGQGLWALPADEEGGPVYQALYRYPIRPDVYEKHGDRLVVKGNPFTSEMGMHIDAAAHAAYTKLLPSLMMAAAGKNHLMLQEAWRRALAAGDDSPLLKQLETPPFDSATAMQLAAELGQDPTRDAELEAEWASLFKDRYAAVLAATAAQASATAP